MLSGGTAKTLAVLGAGAWGTALAQIACRAGWPVTLWARDSDLVDSMRTHRMNGTYLADVALDESMEITGDLSRILDAACVILAVPVQHMRGFLERMARVAPVASTMPLIVASKGIEQTTGCLPCTLVSAVFPHNPCLVLSGPSFAREAALGQPTAVVLAASDDTLARRLAGAFATPTFRPYTSNDVIGVQLGGAVKNVLAVACGIATGLGYGENARAALITRGLNEMVRLGLAYGAKAETFMGLAGLGDLVLTCSSVQSRNMSLGVELGQGRALADIVRARRTVAEGVASASAVTMLAQRKNLTLPLLYAVDRVLNHGTNVRHTVDDLLARPAAQPEW